MVYNKYSVRFGIQVNILKIYTFHIFLARCEFIISDRWGSGNTVATLDLGGSSTQVTFSTNENGKERSLSDHMFSVKTSSPEEKVDLFTISYSNLGRISFRNDILSQNNSEEASNWYTICMHPDSKPYKLKLTTKSHIV